MIDCPLIPPTANRLVQPHRPNSLVLSDPADLTKLTIRQQHGLKLGQTLSWNAKIATFNLKKNASTAVTGPTDSTLSPQIPTSPRGFLPERFSNAGHSRAKPKDCTLARIGIAPWPASENLHPTRPMLHFVRTAAWG